MQLCASRMPLVPSTQPGNESSHVTLVFAIRVAKPGGELRLLEERNVHDVNREKQDRPLEVWPREQNERFAEKHEENPRDHRVPHVSIWSPHHQVLRRIPRRERAAAERDEEPERRNEKRQAHDDQSDSGDLRGELSTRPAEVRRDLTPSGNPDGDERCDGERQHRDRDEVAEDRGYRPCCAPVPRPPAGRGGIGLRGNSCSRFAALYTNDATTTAFCIMSAAWMRSETSMRE